MSRIGKKIIKVPAGAEVKLDGQRISVKGPKGMLTMTLHPLAKITHENDELIVSVAQPDDRKERAIWGLMRTLVENLIVGVTEGYKKELEINGIGFKAAMQGKDLLLNVGFSHPVQYKAPEGITLAVEKNIISVFGIDKHLVGQTTAEIRSIKKPEPYKGKGIRNSGEVVKLKPGKVVKAGG